MPDLQELTDSEQARLVGGASTIGSTVVGPVQVPQLQIAIAPVNGAGGATPPAGPGAPVVELTAVRKPGDGTLWLTTVTTASPR